jgi:hypothetical protein
MFHASRTLKNGATPTERKVLDVTLANSPPVSALATRTVPMVPRGQWQNIDLITFTALTNFDIGIWWWYESAELWVLDANLGGVGGAAPGFFRVDHTDGVVRIPILDNNKSACADGLYLEVTNLGAGANPKVWLQGQQ